MLPVNVAREPVNWDSRKCIDHAGNLSLFILEAPMGFGGRSCLSSRRRDKFASLAVLLILVSTPLNVYWACSLGVPLCMRVSELF